MNRSVRLKIARIYEQRRQQAEAEHERRQEAVYRQFPEIEALDKQLAVLGAKRALAALEPGLNDDAAAELATLQDKRASLIERLGIADDFDRVRYHCDICADTGRNKDKRCTCYQSLLVPLLTDKSNLLHLSDLTMANFDLTLFSDRADPGLYKADLSPRRQMSGLKNLAEQYIAGFSTSQSVNLLFLGKPGTGKTFLMAAIGHALLTKGRSVLYLTAPDLFNWWREYRTLTNSFNPDPVRLENSEAFKSSLYESDLLLIDDLGTESASDIRYGEFLSIIDIRQGSGRPMIISSNIDPGRFKEQYDERLLSRLLGNFSIYRFFGEDVRLEQNRRRL